MAAWVAAGIFLSRIFGLLRERVFAYYFGSSDAGDAFKAALRIPNLLQNLLGEGVLSASFIPEYVKSKSHNPKESAQLAWSLLWILSFVMFIVCTLGVLAAPLLVTALTPGFSGDKRDLTISIVRILFPGVGILVLSAWCLGILNSHKKFFLPYVAPVLWNLAIIGALIFAPHVSESELAIRAAWGLGVGSLLQVLIQWPTTYMLIRPVHFTVLVDKRLRRVGELFLPTLIGRGVVQLSSYFDNVLASFLGSGAVSILSFAQTIYLLPISLFGMSVSAAELPMLSEQSASQRHLQRRLARAYQNLIFYTTPSAVACIFLSPQIVSLLFETGKFSVSARTETAWVLSGYGLGVYFSTQSRLWVSVLYAQGEATKVLRTSLLRVTLSMILGSGFSYLIHTYAAQVATLQLINIATLPAAAGIAFAASISSCAESLRLKTYFSLSKRSYRILRKNLAIMFLASIIPIAASHLLFRFTFMSMLSQAMVSIGLMVFCYLVTTTWIVRLRPATLIIRRLQRVFRLNK